MGVAILYSIPVCWWWNYVRKTLHSEMPSSRHRGSRDQRHESRDVDRGHKSHDRSHDVDRGHKSHDRSHDVDRGHKSHDVDQDHKPQDRSHVRDKNHKPQDRLPTSR